jgi:Chaperone of endosialidase
VINFPDAPTNGQQFQSGASTWQWDATKWIPITTLASLPLTVPNGGTGTVTLPVNALGFIPPFTTALLHGQGTTPVITGTANWTIQGGRFAGAEISMISAVTGATNLINMFKGEGTLAAPTKTNNNLTLGTIGFGGHDGTYWQASSCLIQAASTEDWTGSARGSQLIFRMTPNGSVSASGAVTFTGAGGINTNGPVTINLNAAAMPVISGTPLQVVGADGANNTIMAASFGSTALQSYMTLRRGRGTGAAPTAVQTSDGLGQFNVHGRAATTWAFGGGMNWIARENWTDTANGTYVNIQTIAPGTTTAEQPVLIGRGLIVGSPISNDPGPGCLALGGGLIRFMGGAYPLQNADNANFAWQLGPGNGAYTWYTNPGIPIMTLQSGGVLYVPSGMTVNSVGTTASGSVSLNPGSTANTGYISWTKPGGTRFAYFGYSQTVLTLVLEGGGGVNFSISGGSVYPDPQGTYWCGLPSGSGPWWYGVAAQTFPVQSDARHKTDITTFPADCLDLVEAIAPKRYQYTDAPEGEEGRIFWGYIAQEVGEVFDAAGHDFSGAHRVHGEDGWHSLDYGQMNAVLWKAVQELTARVKSLEAQTQ